VRRLHYRQRLARGSISASKACRVEFAINDCAYDPYTQRRIVAALTNVIRR
jgi:hypothetical protein